MVYVYFLSAGAGTDWGGGGLLFILGSNLGGVGPERGLRGGGRRMERLVTSGREITARAIVAQHGVEAHAATLVGGG